MNEGHLVHASPNLCSAVSGGVKDHLLVGVPTVFALHLGTLIPAATVVLGEARVDNPGLLASAFWAYFWVHQAKAKTMARKRWSFLRWLSGNWL